MLPALVDALNQARKGDFVRAVTCGGCEPDATRIEERRIECTDGTCQDCGIKRLWSAKGGVRESLFEKKTEPEGGEGDEEVWEVRQDVDACWRKRVTWSEYVKQVRPESTRRVAAADEDEDYEQKRKSKELVVQLKEGSLIEFIDRLEVVGTSHMRHRSTLSRQQSSALEFTRERRPGIISRDIDFGTL